MNRVKAGMARQTLDVRCCTSVEELEACVRLQQAVWGAEDREIVPSSMLVVANKNGGHVIGAFDGGALIGMAAGYPGRRDGVVYLYSHILAVRPDCRDRGIGRMLKLCQREDAIARGFDLIEWTFDPLEIRNAHLNINRLGAIARRYTPDYYGQSLSPLQGGLPTDRLTAEWWITSRRVATLLETGKLPECETTAVVRVPAEIGELKAAEQTRPQALAIQSEIGEHLTRAFAQGLAVLRYSVDETGSGYFHCGKWAD